MGREDELGQSPRIMAVSLLQLHYAIRLCSGTKIDSIFRIKFLTHSQLNFNDTPSPLASSGCKRSVNYFKVIQTLIFHINCLFFFFFFLIIPAQKAWKPLIIKPKKFQRVFSLLFNNHWRGDSCPSLVRSLLQHCQKIINPIKNLFILKWLLLIVTSCSKVKGIEVIGIQQ